MRATLAAGVSAGTKISAVDAERAGGIGDRRAMVAARCGDHAGRRQARRQQPIERAARLEAAGMLQQLQLQRHRIRRCPSSARSGEAEAYDGHARRSGRRRRRSSFRSIMAVPDAGTLPLRRDKPLPFRARCGSDCARHADPRELRQPRPATACCCLGHRVPASPTWCCACLSRGFDLVADDQVDDRGRHGASGAATLAGLLEVRGLGIVRLPHVAPARLALVVELGDRADRLPMPAAACRAGPAGGAARSVPRLGAGARRPGAGLRARPRQPGRGSVRGMTAERLARGAGHRPVRRRQGVGAAGAGGPRLRGGGQPAAADARGDGERAASAELAIGIDARTRGFDAAGAGGAGAAARQPGAAARAGLCLGRRNARCCAATPRRGGAIRWRRKAGWPTGSRARNSADCAAARAARTW